MLNFVLLGIGTCSQAQSDCVDSNAAMGTIAILVVIVLIYKYATKEK